MRFLKIVFFASVVLLLFSIFYHSVIEFDQDLGRHLLMGKIISQNFQVPTNNLLSYTHPNFQFVNSHWLSEVIFYQITKLSGSVIFLLYLKVAILFLAFGLTVLISYRHSKSLIATSLAFAIFVPVLLERTEIRPEIFSYLFTAIFLYVLFFDKKKLLWLLPVIEIFWVNLHIYFILGPVLLGVFVLVRRNKLYLALFLFCCLATLINPSGFSGALYPFHVFDNYGYSIVENQNIFFLKDVVFNPNIFYFIVAFCAFVGSFLITDWKKISMGTIGLTTLSILPLLAIRSFPFFFLLELPIFSFNLANLNPALRRRLLLKKSSSVGIILVVIVILLSVWRFERLITNEYYLSIDSHKRFDSLIQESGKGALNFVVKKNLRGPLFNNFDMGSYIAYRLYPEEKVFADGRPEAYPAQFFAGVYIPMQMSAQNFEAANKIYKFNLIIFSHTDATPWAQNFLSEIVKNPKYSLIYLDPYAVVFVKKSTYTNLATHTQSQSYLDELSYAQVFSTFGWTDLAIKAAQKAYSQNPNSPGVLSALAAIYSNNPAASILGQNYAKQFHQKTDLVIF